MVERRPVTVHVVVSGRVQGVGFRWFVRAAARRYGLAGWVRNLPDGTVEVAASGEDLTIRALMRELQHGPDGADVETVEPAGEEIEPPIGNDFQILR